MHWMWMDATLACRSSCCWLAHCSIIEGRSQCGDQGDWSSSKGLTQSFLLLQCCGSGTLHRWKTEDCEWVIMRVLALLCPHIKREHIPQLWPSYQHDMCGFLRLSSQIQQWEIQTRGKRKEKYKKAGHVPNEFKQEDLQRGERSFGGPKFCKFKETECILTNRFCLFTSESFLVCGTKWRVSKHPNQPTHKTIHLDKFILTQIPLDLCQSVKTSPFSGIILTLIFFPSVFGVLWASKLETGCSYFLCKNTCLNSSKAKGKSRLSALVTALDKNSADNS